MPSLTYTPPDYPKLTVAEYFKRFEPTHRLKNYHYQKLKEPADYFATFNHAPDWQMPNSTISAGAWMCEPAMQIVHLTHPQDQHYEVDDADEMQRMIAALPAQVA